MRFYVNGIGRSIEYTHICVIIGDESSSVLANAKLCEGRHMAWGGIGAQTFILLKPLLSGSADMRCEGGLIYILSPWLAVAIEVDKAKGEKRIVVQYGEKLGVFGKRSSALGQGVEVMEENTYMKQIAIDCWVKVERKAINRHSIRNILLPTLFQLRSIKLPFV